MQCHIRRQTVPDAGGVILYIIIIWVFVLGSWHWCLKKIEVLILVLAHEVLVTSWCRCDVTFGGRLFQTRAAIYSSSSSSSSSSLPSSVLTTVQLLNNSNNFQTPMPRA